MLWCITTLHTSLQVCSEEDVEEGTFHLSCCYLDRMVASSFQLVNKSNLQRYASVCMLMASKFKQADILLPSLLHQYTDQSVSSSDLRVRLTLIFLITYRLPSCFDHLSFYSNHLCSSLYTYFFLFWCDFNLDIILA